MNALIWPIVLLAIGLILLIVEVFIPSGGLIGLLALGCLILSVWKAFAHSTTLGLQFLLALLFLMPGALILAAHLWPRTPLAKRIFLRPPGREDLEPSHQGDRLDHLIGQFGRALTPMRPSGMVDFDGRRLDGLSEEGLIPTGALVRAVQVRGGQVVVRLASDRTLNELNEMLT
ncbi:MAG TPA: NfeD family protein [Isosphaeraceae bacterium]|jgi:membrane-bound ClpP family serine protease|nr:NfeD family protein [Isosphaeraceae bacterium]